MIDIYNNIIDITIVNCDARTQHMDIIQLIVIVAIIKVALSDCCENSPSIIGKYHFGSLG